MIIGITWPNYVEQKEAETVKDAVVIGKVEKASQGPKSTAEHRTELFKLRSEELDTSN